MTAVGFSALIIIIALLVDGLFGAALPLVAAGQAMAQRAAVLVGRLDRAERSAGVRRNRGLLLLLVLAGAAAAIGLLLMTIAQASPWFQPLQPLVLAACFGVRRAVDRSRADLRAAPGAAAAPLVAACLVAAYSEGFLASAFWYAAAGLPGALAWRMVATLAAATRGRGEIGRAPAVANDIMLTPPALLAGLLLFGATLFLPSSRPTAVFRVVRSRNWRASSIIAAPEAIACAGLGLAPDGQSPPLAAAEFNRILTLQGIAVLLAVAVLAAMAVLGLAD